MRDTWFLISHFWPIMHAMKGKTITAPFRERLMLAVTQVNGCRYCSWAHTKMALKSGLSHEEILLLLSGQLTHAQEKEIPALLFAQHWADSLKKPEKKTKETLKIHYTENEINQIFAILETIWWGNLMGNTMDYLLHPFNKKKAHDYTK